MEYTNPFKDEVVEYGKAFGQRKTSRLFCISQKRIHEWIKVSKERPEDEEGPAHSSPEPGSSVIMVTPAAETPEELAPDEAGSRKRSHAEATSLEEACDDGRSKLDSISPKSAKQVLDMDVEVEVYNWVHSQLTHPTSTDIRNKAIELYRARGYDKIKCSYGWFRRWSERFKEGTSIHEDSDPLLLSWLLEQYDNNVLVTYSSLQAYAQKTLATLKPDFKASQGWASRFFKRHHVFLNWDGFNDRALPQDLQVKIEEFRLTLSTRMDWSHLGRGQIGCMDEIPLSFAGSKLASKDSKDTGIKMSRLKKISVKNSDATVILALRADGLLLPPMVVVKAQKANSLNQVYSINDSPVIVFYSKSTEPSLACLDKWMELIWTKHINQPSALFYDSYELHQKLEGKGHWSGVKQIIFPPGCSCKLQPINVYAKITFQKLIDSYWEDYLRTNNDDSKIILPSTNEMIEWISQAYETMKGGEHQEKLKGSFQKVELLFGEDEGLG